mmetsp:Transcript_22506/g.64766  ORF Transcript_22506/g.64766 Transcript_22506/m.64766 type:complete len:258 (+) Transcript_22506:408-1181(+)
MSASARDHSSKRSRLKPRPQGGSSAPGDVLEDDGDADVVPSRPLLKLPIPRPVSPLSSSMDHVGEITFSVCARCTAKSDSTSESNSSKAWRNLAALLLPPPMCVRRSSRISRSRIPTTSAGSNSRPSASCHGSSTPSLRDASNLSNSIAQRTTSSATSSPQRSRTSPKVSFIMPPTASHFGASVFSSYGRNVGSPRSDTSRGTPSEPVMQPRCSRAQSRSERPMLCNQGSSRRPTKRTGTEAPLRCACSAAARAAVT